MPTNPGKGYWLYDFPHSDADSLAGHLEDFLKGDYNNTLSIFVVVSKKNLKELIQSWHSSKFRIEFGTLGSNNKIFSIRISRNTQGKKVDEFGSVLIIKSPVKEVYFVMTDESNEFVHTVLRPFLNSYYPDISRVYINSAELQLMLEKLETVTKGKVVVEKVIAYSRIPYEQKEYILSEEEDLFMKERRMNKRKRQAAVIYTQKPYRESFAEAVANDQWVDKVQFNLVDKSRVLLEGYVSRSGLIRMSRSFYPFYQTLSPLIIDIIQKKFELYSNRARKKDNRSPSPLVIEFDHDIFRDVALNHRFIDSLNAMSYVSLSVYHSNPYVHLSLVDYLDGSAFDIWVLSADRITVVPQLRASEASISRLMNHIFETFREGTIKEYVANVQGS